MLRGAIRDRLEENPKLLTLTFVAGMYFASAAAITIQGGAEVYTGP